MPNEQHEKGKCGFLFWLREIAVVQSLALPLSLFPSTMHRLGVCDAVSYRLGHKPQITEESRINTLTHVNVNCILLLIAF